MPNWVFNTINNYPEDVYDKYKGEKTDIDFNKIIPEPEELTNMPSGSYNSVAKNIVKYKEYHDKLDNNSNRMIQYDSSNPLKDVVKNEAERTTMKMGELAIENPDDSLNTILSRDENEFAKKDYDNYVDIFGNLRYSKQKDFETIYNKYIEREEKNFEKFKETFADKKSPYNNFNSLDEFGNKLLEYKEKFGFDNWYDWRVANWGTKWNANESNYCKESGNLTFDTAWSIPYPIISKIANDNPEVTLDGYSEEETGWFEEYTTKDGLLSINCRGELEYDENDSIAESREELDPPEVYTYEQMHNDSVSEWEKFANIKNLIYKGDE